MKTLYFFLIVLPLSLMLSVPAQCQVKALFVNDNGLIKANTDTVKAALTAAGIIYDVFNARDSLRSPTAAEMSHYQYVIWYCSTDGVGNYLWDGNDSDNIDLMMYLESGGKLWLMGTDFLFDRYGSAPDVFDLGSFVYDYLGIAMYNVQSYGDDGGLGVAELDPIEIPFENYPHDTIRWIFSTAWWVDGCTPNPSAVSAYNMGPDSYSLKGYSSAILNHYDHFAGKKELTFTFDPAIMDTYANRVKLFQWSYSTLFAPSPPGFPELKNANPPLITGKNPTNDLLQCKVPDILEGNDFTIAITDFCGKQIMTRTVEGHEVFSVDVSTLSPGVYLLSMTDNKKLYNQKFVVGR